MKIAIFGGSFNPIGNHHIDIAQKLSTFMDEVWIMPCHKSTTGKKLESDEHRINMCNIAIKNSNNPKIKLCSFEIDFGQELDGQTYNSIKKILELHRIGNLPYGYNKDNIYYLVIGMDNALTINTWDNWNELINMLPFIVLTRPGYNSSFKNEWFSKNPHIFLDNIATQNGSSTKIRNDIVNNSHPEIDPCVYQYIKDNKLYIN